MRIKAILRDNSLVISHTYHHTDNHHLLNDSQNHKNKCSCQVCQCNSEHNHQCLQCTHLYLEDETNINTYAIALFLSELTLASGVITEQPITN